MLDNSAPKLDIEIPKIAREDKLFGNPIYFSKKSYIANTEFVPAALPKVLSMHQQQNVSIYILVYIG